MKNEKNQTNQLVGGVRCYHNLTRAGMFMVKTCCKIHRAPHRQTPKGVARKCEWKRKPSTEEKKRYGRDKGIVGESSLWKLYHMYRFDLSLDLVFDAMHIED
jgi:hypothetical protein